MSQLTIDDLNFCESQLPSNSEVQGGWGISVFYPTGRSSGSVSASSAHNASYFTGFFFDERSGSIGHVMVTGVPGTVAGATAGTLADGRIYASSFSRSDS